jgi:hypothetical protein
MLLGVSGLTEELLASQEGLYCMVVFKWYSVSGHNHSQVPAKYGLSYKQRHRIS